jgi:iron complex outermembrane receptor protein
MNSNFRRALFVGGAMAAAAFASGALAQGAEPAPAPAAGEASSQGGALEEIVVTARRREENLQTTPVAITAVSSEMLEARNVVSLEKIAQIAPSFTLFNTTGSMGAAGTYMRGIGYSDNVIGQDSPIGFYIDGVAAGRVGTATLDLVEPDRVEVLRGPQGTLFGRNTTGGAISITTHTPSDEFSGMVKASYGTYNAYSFQGRVDTGLIGDSGVKFSFGYQHRQQDGSHDALQRPRDLDPGAEKSDSFFAKGVGEWGDFKATLSADYSDVSGVPLSSQIVDASANERSLMALSPTYGGGSYVITRKPQYKMPYDAYNGLQHVWNEGVALTLEYKLNDNFTLKSISGLRAFKRHDPSGYGLADFRVNVGTDAAPVIRSFNGNYGLDDRYQSQRQRSEELQLLGAVGDFDFVAGGYYFKEDAWDYGKTRLPFALSPTTALDSISYRLYTVDSKSVAGFAQVNWRPSALDKKLELTGGVRWTKDNRDFVQTQPLVRTVPLESKNTSFLASVNYQWTSDIMTYARFSTGYRAGGFNARSNPPVDPIFKPEKIKSWEVGFKAEGWDHRLRVNGAAFYNKYRNLQVPQFAPPNGVSSGGSTAVNANATYKGFELEAEAVPVEGLTLNASVGYVDPVYKRFPKALEGGRVSGGCSPITNAAGAITGQDCAKIAKFNYFPNTTVGLGASYTLPMTSYGEWSFRTDYAWKSHIYGGTFDLPSTPFQNSIYQKAYGLLSARIALSEIPLAGGDTTAQIALFGENLTNEKYIVQGIDYGFMATAVFGDRRTFGIEGKVNF